MSTGTFSQRTPRRVLYGVACSGAVHGALLAAVSLGSCLSDATSPEPAAATAVSVDILAADAPAAARPAPATAQPGGGVPSPRAGDASHAAKLPPHVVAGPPAAPSAPAQPEPLLAQATADDGLEVPATATSDADAGSDASLPQAPDADPPSSLPPANAAAPGTGPGLHGGPGGLGHGARQARLPAVAGKFTLGGDVGDFKAVLCFIRPGTLRIADVHGCDPVAVFYTDTFNIPERQFTEGFPGVTDRASWFMIDYRGSFGVKRDGIYKFRLHSDDGTYLYIDGAMVVENDGKHKPESRGGSVYLHAGRHQLKLLYAQTTDRMALQLFVRVPGSWDEKLFTSEL